MLLNAGFHYSATVGDLTFYGFTFYENNFQITAIVADIRDNSIKFVLF